MKDFLRMVGDGAVVPDGRNGYTVDGASIDAGRTRLAVASGYLSWTGSAYRLTDAAKAKAAT